MKRARIGAFALAVAATGTLAVTVALSPAQAKVGSAPNPGLAAVTTTVTNGDARLIVDPTTGLPDAGAEITVRGSGFPADTGLYVAVCPSGERAPADLTGCIGGPADGSPTTGPWVREETDGDGAFSATLTLPADASGSAACVPDKCALYTVRTDGEPGADMRVPVAFTSSTSSSSAPSTPSSAIVQQVASATIAPGATQQVIFSGFRAGEQVNLTLFSAPVVLSPVNADPTGVARVDFVVPADFVDGTHRLEAIGAESGTVGVASFQVLIPTPTPSPTPTPTPTPTPSPSPTTSSPTSSATTSSAAPTTAPTTSAAAGGDDDGGNWWIWLILGLVVLAGLITWFVVYRRNKEAARAEQEKQLADAASREQGAGGYDPMANAPTMVLPLTNPPPGSPPPGADPYGLLSGRNYPYGVDPNAPTRVDPPGPTQQMPPGPTQIIGGPTQVIPPGAGPSESSESSEPSGPSGPPTGRLPRLGSDQGGPGSGQGAAPDWTVPSEFAGDAPSGSSQASGGQSPEGPGTKQFRPDLDEGDDRTEPPDDRRPER
jgi:hypothetical protein